MSSSNPNVDVTINKLDLGALLMQLLIFAPRIAPLAHIHIYVNNISAQEWANRGSVITVSSVGSILKDIAFASRRQHIHASIRHVPGE